MSSVLTARTPVLPTVARQILSVVSDPVGGICAHLRYNYPALSKAGYRFTFVMPAETSQELPTRTFAELYESEVVRVSGRGEACKLWPAIRETLRRGNFDAIHSHGLIAAIEAVRGNWGFGISHIATIHDVLRAEQFSGWLGWGKRRLLGWALGQVDTLVAVGEDVRRNLLEFLPSLRGRDESLGVIRNGIDVERFANPPQPERELRHDLHLSPGTPLWGFLGRFTEQKGFLPLVEALALLHERKPDVDFHLVAFGSGDQLATYRRVVDERGLSGHITFRPFVPDIETYLKQLDMLVVPSLWEATGLPALEAMVAGIPVLGTDCIGLREVLAGTPSRMTRAGDVESLYQGLLEAWQTPWNEAAHGFAPEAARRFGNRHPVRQLLTLLDRTTGGNG